MASSGGVGAFQYVKLAVFFAVLSPVLALPGWATEHEPPPSAGGATAVSSPAPVPPAPAAQLTEDLVVQAPPPPAPPRELAPEKPPRALLVNLRSRNYYDSWENDLIAQCQRFDGKFRPCSELGRSERDNHESGSQFTTKLDLFAKFQNFELSVTGGYVDTSYERKRAEIISSTGAITELPAEQGSASITGATDTEVNFVYNNFDRKTWGIELGARANLPTGITSLTTKELRGVPSEDVVTTAATGEGFNLGPLFKYWKQSGDTSWFAGARALYLGSYDLTSNIAGDTVDSGYEGAIELGLQHPRWRAGYTLINLNRGGADLTVWANLLYAGISSAERETGIFWRGDGTVGYNTVDVGEDSLANRRAQFQDGFSGSLDSEFGYKWANSLALSLLAGIKGSVNRDVENQFVNPTSRKLYGGVGASYDLFKTRFGTMSLNAQAKYVDLISSPAVTVKTGLERGGRDDINYDVYQVFFGISYAFSRLF